MATIFFLQNTGPSVIHVPFGRPYQAGLIYVLLIAFFAGAVTATSVVLIVQRKLSKRRALAQAEEDYDLIDEK